MVVLWLSCLVLSCLLLSCLVLPCYDSVFLLDCRMLVAWLSFRAIGNVEISCVVDVLSCDFLLLSRDCLVLSCDALVLSCVWLISNLDVGVYVLSTVCFNLPLL